MPPAMIERSQALNRMIYLRFSNVKSTHPIEEDIGIKILKMTTKVKMSHSIHMLSIQIDTKSLWLFNNIKLSFFASHMKRSFAMLYGY